MKIVVFWFSFKTKHSTINLTPFFYRSDFSKFFNLFFFEMNNFKHTKSVFGQQTSSFFQFEANVFRIAIYLLIKCYATFAFLSKISAATNNFNCEKQLYNCTNAKEFSQILRSPLKSYSMMIKAGRQTFDMLNPLMM